MKIEWDSDHTDGRRRPKASTVHGWLAKMRGTLIGDESLRSRGMREMKEARAIRAYTKQKKAQRRKGSGMLSLFGGKKKSTSSRSGSGSGSGAIESRGGHRSRHHSASHRIIGYVTQQQNKLPRSRGSSSNRSRNTGSRHTHHSTSRRSRRTK